MVWGYSCWNSAAVAVSSYYEEEIYYFTPMVRKVSFCVVDDWKC
jgi:hypothetical protein